MHRVVACDRRPVGGLPSHHYSSALLGTQSTCSAPSSRFLLLPPGSVGIRFKILDPGPRLTRRGGPARPGRRLAGEEFTQTELTRPTPMKQSKQEGQGKSGAVPSQKLGAVGTMAAPVTPAAEKWLARYCVVIMAARCRRRILRLTGARSHAARGPIWPDIKTGGQIVSCIING